LTNEVRNRAYGELGEAKFREAEELKRGRGDLKTWKTWRLEDLQTGRPGDLKI
jgi:hypothetical protein